MGKGLSEQQKKILLLAYEDYLKPEEYLDHRNDGTTITISSFEEAKAYVEEKKRQGEEFICLFTEKNRKEPHVSSPEILKALFDEKDNAARASTSRALTRLTQRGLLKPGEFWSYCCTSRRRWGYYLTDQGLEVVKQLMVNNHYNIHNINR